MMATRPENLPRDPLQRAKAIVDVATGTTPEPKPLPAHVTVAGDVATCGHCGETFTLSKRPVTRADELRGFGAIHAHA